MKKLFFTSILLLLTLISILPAQIVSIPDINFKNKLIALGKDLNQDGEIQQSEAAAVTSSLNISSSNISSLVGIEAFINIGGLNCSNNSLSSLDISNLTGLTTLQCQNNQLVSITVANVNNGLTHLNISNNPIDSLNLQHSVYLFDINADGCSLLRYLNCMNSNGFAYFEHAGVTALEYVNISNCDINILDLSSCPNLSTLIVNNSNIGFLYVQNTSLISLSANNCPYISSIKCQSNPLAQLSFLNCPNLDTLQCQNTLIDSLDLSANPTLKQLLCYNNMMPVVDVSACIDLRTLDCHNNPITNIDVSNCTNLYNLILTDCSNLISLVCPISTLANLNITGCTALESIDRSNSPNNVTLDVSFCPNLSSLLVSGNIYAIYCQGTQIQNLDLSNCGLLHDLDCSNNSIDTLNLSQCVQLYSLNCSNTFISKLHLYNFQDLYSLNCANTLIDSLILGLSGQLEIVNTNNCPNLVYVNCSYNNTAIVSLDVSECPNLTFLDCHDNPVINLNLSNTTHIQMLDVRGNALTSLDVSGFNDLQYLDCSFSWLSSLNVSNCPILETLDCHESQVINLDLSNLSNLQTLNCSTCALTGLNVSNCTSLTQIMCNTNQLSNLDFSTCTNLVHLDCFDNLLTNLNLSNLVNLEYLDCSSPGSNTSIFNNFDASDCVKLQYLNCSRTGIGLLDLNNSPLLTYLDCSYAVTQLLIKNGSVLNYLNFDAFLSYVCLDDDPAEITQVLLQAQANLTNLGYFGSICTFPIGGYYNRITGNIAYDYNANGCGATDPGSPNMLVNITKNLTTEGFVTNILGNYNGYADTGTFIVKPILQDSAYFTISPTSSTVNFSSMNNSNYLQDFCITPNGNFPDVEIVLSPIKAARPGFNTSYSLIIHNKGNVPASGNFSLSFMGNKMSFVTASTTPSSQSSNQLVWSYSNLHPFEFRNLTLVMHVLPPPTSNFGDIVQFHANMPLTNDVANSDNDFIFNQTLTGSYDPNLVSCLDDSLQDNSTIGNYLHYVIQFQNTGTYYAEKVMISNALNSGVFDFSSLQILGSSHPFQLRIKDNELVFYFDQIMLADSFTNEPESHGYVIYKIKTKEDLVPNSIVLNSANIFFDYNLPVYTNTEVVSFSDLVGIQSPIQYTYFQCYPNPVQNTLTIETSKPGDFEIVNSMGQVILRKNIENQTSIDISTFSSGLYWIKEKNAMGGKSFVKE